MNKEELETLREELQGYAFNEDGIIFSPKELDKHLDEGLTVGQLKSKYGMHWIDWFVSKLEKAERKAKYEANDKALKRVVDLESGIAFCPRCFDMLERVAVDSKKLGGAINYEYECFGCNKRYSFKN